MTERTASWRWASARAREQFLARAHDMGLFQPYPKETRSRYRAHVLAAIDELTRFPEGAPATAAKKMYRAKTIASPGTAQGEVIVYSQDRGGVVVVYGVFGYVPGEFFGN